MTAPAPFADVAVVMITMNEEHSVRSVAKALRESVPGASVTIVDSSSDATPERAAEEGIEVVRQYPPQGYGPAMARALMHPTRPIVVTLDCDGTYPAGRIPDLVRRIREGHDIVGGTRLASGRPTSMPVANYLANKLFNLVASVVFLRRVRDVHSGMRAYRREVIHAFAWQATPPALPVELLLLPIRAGRRVEEIPIAYHPRVGDTTLNRWSSTHWTFRRIVRNRLIPLSAVRSAPA
jgi:glycosyltransferase involved in cell wall biosynthesis